MLLLIDIICYHYRCNTYHELDEIMINNGFVSCHSKEFRNPGFALP